LSSHYFKSPPSTANNFLVFRGIYSSEQYLPRKSSLVI
jgi:hypothetical protein